MLNFINLLTELVYINDTYEFIHKTLLGVMIVLMAISAIAAIVLILLQPSNSSGIDALGGSSETFFGKNKGKSIEAKMKKWTWLCLLVLAVFSIAFYVILELPIFFS
jgi:preprotein translocase subunit SecG